MCPFLLSFFLSNKLPEGGLLAGFDRLYHNLTLLALFLHHVKDRFSN